MKKIAVLTATRAEYGLLKNLIIALKREPWLKVEVLVTGAHLSPEHGLTYHEIENDGICIAKKIEILMNSDTSASISKSMGLAMIGFAEYFEESRPDVLLVLGDRYEALAVCCAAMNARIPIFHLHGGEITEGAIDEAVRHSITKMSYLHFTSTEEYRHRVIQLGENPKRVFCVGALGVENVLREEKMSRKELAESIGFELSKPYGVVTFHPVTLEGDTEKQCKEILRAIEELDEYQFIITGANADCGGNATNKMLMEFAKNHKNIIFIMSLGLKRYLSALQYASFVMGNSSSGLLEAPSFRIPTINVGSRQRGRIKADSVLDCSTNAKEIVKAVRYVVSGEFQRRVQSTVNPYGDGHTVEKILNITRSFLLNEDIDLKKKFFDVEFEE